INVIGKPDIVINSFTSTSDGQNLQLSYSVNRGPAVPFNIALYASSDGTSLDQELQVVPAQSYGVGTYSQTISAAFDDPQQDYYLIAVADIDDDVAEFDETNNTAAFAGGAFLN